MVVENPVTKTAIVYRKAATTATHTKKRHLTCCHVGNRKAEDKNIVRCLQK